MFRVEADGLAAIGNHLVVLSLAAVGSSPAAIRPAQLWVQANGLGEVGNRLVAIVLHQVGRATGTMCCCQLRIKANSLGESNNSGIEIVFLKASHALPVGFLRRISTCRNVRQQHDCDQHDHQSLAGVHGFPPGLMDFPARPAGATAAVAASSIIDSVLWPILPASHGLHNQVATCAAAVPCWSATIAS